MFNIKILSDNIKKYRAIRKITQKELAEMLNVSPQAVSRWECGLCAPDISNLYDISSLLGVSVDTLIGANNSYVKTMIAVDGGGSKTEFVLFDETGRILNKIILGGCNPNFYGQKKSAEILKSGIDMLLGQSPNPLGIYIGCAGFGSADNAKEIKDILKQTYPHIKINCKSDIFNVIASATEDEKCLAAICGTGIVVYAIKEETFKRFGGWGYLLDNGGSGFDIGRDVLRVAVSEKESGKIQSKITGLVEAKLGGDAYSKFTDIYKKDVSFIASFAPIAFEAFRAGDKKAIEILEKNADRFYEYIKEASSHFKDYKTIVISGSIVTKDDLYLSMLKKRIGKSLNIVIPEHSQIFGACIRCAKMCGIPTEKIAENFTKNYYKGEF